MFQSTEKLSVPLREHGAGPGSFSGVRRLVCCYLTLQPIREASAPLREHSANLLLSVVFGVLCGGI